jgi:hypothetical protein
MAAMDDFSVEWIVIVIPLLEAFLIVGSAAGSSAAAAFS